MIKVSQRLVLPRCKPSARHAALHGMLVKRRPFRGADSPANGTLHSPEGHSTSDDWLCCTSKAQPCTTWKPGGHHIRGESAAFAAVAEISTLQAVYSVLKEAEHRSTFYIPYWNLPLAMQLVPRQRRFTENLGVSRSASQCCASCQLLRCAAQPVHVPTGASPAGWNCFQSRERLQGLLSQSAWHSGCSSTALWCCSSGGPCSSQGALD